MGHSRVRTTTSSCWKPTTILNYSVEVRDMSLTDYIQLRHAVYLPHTAGRYAKKQFKKAQMPIVERLVDRYEFILASTQTMHHSWDFYVFSLMMKGRNNGKKLLAVRIVAHAFEIIHLLTDQNPIQVRHIWQCFDYVNQDFMTGSRRCHRQHRSSWRFHPHRFARNRSSSSRRCVPSSQSQPVHCPPHSWRTYLW